jgi:hypothetical protein
MFVKYSKELDFVLSWSHNLSFVMLRKDKLADSTLIQIESCAYLSPASSCLIVQRFPRYT